MYIVVHLKYNSVNSFVYIVQFFQEYLFVHGSNTHCMRMVLCVPVTNQDDSPCFSEWRKDRPGHHTAGVTDRNQQ